MARAKVKCKGTNKDGSSCQNWAVEGSLYCHQHQHQETAADRKQMKKNENIATGILAVILLVGFFFSLALGCEQEFAEWAV